jgi:hypothetical protein
MVVFGYLLCRKYYPIPYEMFPILASLFLTFTLGYLVLQTQNMQMHIAIKLASFVSLIAGIYIYEKYIYKSPIAHDQRSN